MSTTEDFENAPIGATATAPNGDVALNTGRFAFDWAVYNSSGGFHALLRSDELKGFTIDPTHPAPTTAREALDLAWELAHPIKEGQEIPGGTQYLHKDTKPFTVQTLNYPCVVTGWDVQNIRTIDPLPEPDWLDQEPNWLDAPAVVAWVKGRVGDPQVLVRENEAGTQWVRDTKVYHWTELIVVDPLYPKEDA